MDIVVKPVKFGDCSVFIGSNDVLAVDCGSKNRKNPPGGLSKGAFSYSKIEDYVNREKLNQILVSHFDEDHFNGFLQIPDTYKRIEKVYIPYSIVGGKSVLSGSLSRILTVASPRSWGYTLSKSILKFFDKITKLTSIYNIVQLKRGDTFEFAGKTMRVLWPDVHTSRTSESFKYYYGDDEKRQKIFLELCERNGFVSFLRYQEQLQSNFDKFINLLTSSQQEGDGEGEHNSEEQLEYVKMHIADLLEEIQVLRREVFMSYNGKLSWDNWDDVKKYYLEEYHHLIDEVNATSIVFDSGNDLAFLGDVPARIIDAVLRYDFKEQYKAVKIQHHATTRYYTNNTPFGEYGIISNGGYSKWFVDDRFIDLPFENIVCTNAHTNEQYCLRTHGGGICDGKCIKVAGDYTIKV